MFLSIIIPVHNTEKYIHNCLDSCLAQDISDDDYEIICVDDYSTDHSVDILHEYQVCTPNLKVICQPKNRGVSVARNAGIEHIQGNYCMFLDSDDYLEDNCLARLKSILSESENNTILCVGQYHFVEEGVADRHANKTNGEYFGCPTERYITNRLIPSAFISQLRFQEDIAYGEDEVFCIELDVLFKPKYLQLNEPIYYYRRHSESAMTLTTEKAVKRFESVVNAAVFLKEKYGFQIDNIRLFIRERLQIAFSFVSKQNKKKRKGCLRLMKNRGLSFPFKNWNYGYDINVAYVIYHLKRMYGIAQTHIVKKFPFVLKVKRIIKHQKYQKDRGISDDNKQ